MSLCTVTELRSVLGIGQLYTDAQLQEVCDAADAVLLPMLWRNQYPVMGTSNSTTEGFLWFDFYAHDIFHEGQSVTIAGCGSAFNGTKTIDSVGETSIKVTTNQQTSTEFQLLSPYGTITGTTTTDYTTDSAVQLAAQFIATDIWQARNAAGMGSVGIDGTPMPYRLNTQLISKVRGLISHILHPGGLVG